jgi:dipeptidyl aminopeptidase/acylaminoacyl peptidase
MLLTPVAQAGERRPVPTFVDWAARIVMVIGMVAWPCRVAAQGTGPLPIETALSQASFPPYAPIALSRDDRWVAYTLSYPKLVNQVTVGSWFTSKGTPSTAIGARVRITDTKTGETVSIGDEGASNWGPAWSPDGRSLAFYSDADGRARLWVYEAATHRTRRVSDAIIRGHRAVAYPRWTPDSRSVVVPIVAHGSDLPETVRSKSTEDLADSDSARVVVMRADPAHRYGGQFEGGRSMNNRSSLEADLALVNMSSGRVTTLAHGYWPLEYQVAPTGRFMVFTSEKPAILRPRWTVPYDVLVVGLTSAKPKAPRLVVGDAPLQYGARNVLWSPDGATLLYSATDSTGQIQYFVADSGAWRPRRVGTSGSTVLDTSTVAFEQAMHWAEDGQSFFALSARGIAVVSMPAGLVQSRVRMPEGYEVMALMGRRSSATVRSEGGRSVLAIIHNDSTKRMGFARVDVVTGRCTILMDADRHFGVRYDLPVDVASDGSVAFLSEDSQHPRDVWVSGPDLTSPRQLTHVAPEMERYTYGRTRLIDFTTAAGGKRRGALLLPADYRAGERYPLVVYPYPLQSRSNDLNVFGVEGAGVENMQLLATRGFAVLAPDVPPFDWKDQMRDLASIIQRGADRVIELGIADSTRLGIMGHSWGGYTTLAMIVQTNRFGAAVMRGGIGDHVSTTAILQRAGFAYGLQLEEMFFGGAPWDVPELYHKNSPIYLLDRVRTPLLIIHGEGETTVPVFLADQVFAGLQRLGKEVEFARYPNENHNESRWTHAHQRDYVTRMIGWFETHLVGDLTSRRIAAPSEP